MHTAKILRIIERGRAYKFGLAHCLPIRRAIAESLVTFFERLAVLRSQDDADGVSRALRIDVHRDA